MKGGFVMPTRSMVLRSAGSSATIAFNRFGRFVPISLPENFEIQKKSITMSLSHESVIRTSRRN
jgi:hypothetical protein